MSKNKTAGIPLDNPKESIPFSLAGAEGERGAAACAEGGELMGRNQWEEKSLEQPEILLEKHNFSPEEHQEGKQSGNTNILCEKGFLGTQRGQLKFTAPGFLVLGFHYLHPCPFQDY